MNKTCTNCNVPFKEYVPHNSLPGDANCEWICFDPNCSDEITKETTPGIQDGLIEWPNDWDVTWTALRAEIEQDALNYHRSGDEFYVSTIGSAVTLVVRQGVNRMFNYCVRVYSIPTQSAPVSGLREYPATVPSSLKLHTPLSTGVGLGRKANATLLLNQDLASGRIVIHTPPPQVDHPPQKSSTPTLQSQIVIDHMNRLYWGDCPDCYRGCSEEDWMAVIGLV